MQDVIYRKFVPEGKTVNRKFCCQVLERLLKQFLQMRPVLKGSWFLLHSAFPFCHRS
jgi:hypothetical protein